jgi:hypothetical protein
VLLCDLWLAPITVDARDCGNLGREPLRVLTSYDRIASPGVV